jgi:hypothetical protein
MEVLGLEIKRKAVRENAIDCGGNIFCGIGAEIGRGRKSR